MRVLKRTCSLAHTHIPPNRTYMYKQKSFGYLVVNWTYFETALRKEIGSCCVDVITMITFGDADAAVVVAVAVIFVFLLRFTSLLLMPRCFCGLFFVNRRLTSIAF